VNSSNVSRNIPLFIAFRVLFNARWYYPVMSVLFLDFGLTVEQYALLNVVWAAAIVGLEVPSGALADFLGRKRMVVFAAVLMLIEMAVFAFAPRENPALLFALFLVNRLLSGAAEASASGADEALAYDSLVADGRESEWPNVLEKLMRWQSAAFFAAMMLGAAFYDAGFVQSALNRFGIENPVTQEMTMRFPIYLTLINAVLALIVTLNLREPPVSKTAEIAVDSTPVPPAENPWRATLAAGRWILATPLALSIILAGLCFDSIVRLFLTFGSNYYRAIELPAATFGLIGSGFALFGFFVPRFARKLTLIGSMQRNFWIVAALIFTGLVGISWALPVYGLLWLVPLGVAMSMTQFFVSHYLNEQVTDSRKRATVLSFRGLAFNLGYGGVGLLFAGLTRFLREKNPGTASEDQLFVEALGWLPWYFLATIALFTWISIRTQRSILQKSSDSMG
jgi:MFS family permease